MKSFVMRWTIAAAAWGVTAGGLPAQTYWPGNPGLISSPAVALDTQGHLEVLALFKDGALWEIQQTGPETALGWSPWMSLGHPEGLTLNGVPEVGTDVRGNLHVFVQAEGGALWHNWQVPGTSAWNGWYSLGAPPSAINSAPAVGTNLDGRLELFVLGSNNAMYHNWEEEPGSVQGWSGWNQLGQGSFSSAPAVARDNGGPLLNSLEVFAIGTDWPTPHLYHIWQTPPGAGWSDWTSLGGWFSPGVAVGQNQFGLEVFSIGDTAGELGSASPNAISLAFQVGQGSTSWSPFSDLPATGGFVFSVCGSTNLLGMCTSFNPVSLQVAKSPDGRLELFAQYQDGGNNFVWHQYQTTPDPNAAVAGGLSGWAVDYGFGALPAGMNPGFGIGVNRDQRLEAFALGQDGNLWHNWQVAPGDGWSGWFSLGQPAPP